MEILIESEYKGMRRKHKKKTGIIIICVICAIAIVGLLMYIFLQQWTWKGYSRNLNLSISEDKGLQMIHKDEESTIYTYNLEECYITVFSSGAAIDLEEALGKYISLSQILKNMSREEKEEMILYKGEAYQIIQLDNIYIICGLNQKAEEIANLIH